VIIPNENRRYRYICFHIKSLNEKIDISKEEFNKKLKSQCINLFNINCYKKGIRLIRFDGIAGTGIVKCKHTEKENTIKLLNSIDNISTIEVKVETFGTSGTIKALIKKYLT
jgi:RNase P/RNase MRP subunit POP5